MTDPGRSFVPEKWFRVYIGLLALLCTRRKGPESSKVATPSSLPCLSKVCALEFHVGGTNIFMRQGSINTLGAKTHLHTAAFGLANQLASISSPLWVFSKTIAARYGNVTLESPRIGTGLDQDPSFAAPIERGTTVRDHSLEAHEV